MKIAILTSYAEALLRDGSLKRFRRGENGEGSCNLGRFGGTNAGVDKTLSSVLFTLSSYAEALLRDGISYDITHATPAQNVRV